MLRLAMEAPAMETTLKVSGMHCPACVKRLTDAFQQVPGVRSAHVTLSPPEAHIQSDNGVSVEALDRAARSTGNYFVTAGSAAPPQVAAHHAQHEPETVTASTEPKPSIYPLLLIVGYIAGAVALATWFRSALGWSWHTFMLDFMAGFFLVFSFFKLLDLRGFVDAYQSYDILARPFRPWGFAYPFIELALGIAYLTRFELFATNVATLLLMLMGSVGVLRALLKKKAIRCACLGTALNLPMTTVTLVEDVGMAAMAAIMLLWR
jgi:cation transport ATPase